MDLTLQLLANGLAKWPVYVLLACGFGILYRTLRVFHISFAALILVAPYAALALHDLFGLQGAVAALLAIPFAIAVGCALEIAIFGPLDARGAGPEGGMIASLGVYLALQSLIALMFGQGLLVLPAGIPEAGAQALPLISNMQAFAVVVAVALGLPALTLLLRTSAATRLRALGDDPKLFAFYGGRLGMTRLLAWTCAAGFASVAGLLQVADVGIDPRSGMQLFLAAAVAVFLGGRDRALGWVVGALCVALAENIATLWTDARWAPAFVYGTALLLLLVRPSGIVSAPRRFLNET